MPRRKRAITSGVATDIKHFQSNLLDTLTLGPDDLCRKTQSALSALSEEDRGSSRDELLAGLRKAGVNISSALLVLGIPARTPDELTPPDLGKLLRYVRINRPSAIQALAEPLARLLWQSAEPAPAVQKVREAA